MDSRLNRKLNALKQILLSMDKVLVAFSAGVDSSFLLKVASMVLGKRVLAVCAVSLTYSASELKAAKKIARRLGVRLKVIRSKEFDNPKFIQNSLKRCYYCKKELFSKLRQLADKEGIKYIVDGSNLDDDKDFRPGKKAKEEYAISSPLAQVGLCKKDIRRLSRHLELDTWNKPQLACLASRIPYGRKISKSVLRKIEKGEDFLKKLGFRDVRLRDYGILARIEVEKNRIKELIQPAVGQRIIDRLKKLGYNYVTVDLEGYRAGSLNETILRGKYEKNIS
ncbi:MAG: ATP-dependent sacrificial sulfur transferase LarE [Candidatus Omnitrophota bacterium]